MKNLLSILVLSLIFFPTYIFAQIDDFCGTQLLARESLDLTQQGGIYLTSQNELKVLVVFVRFKDDTTYHPHWPVGQPPNNYNTFIDPNLQTNSTHYINLTNYYKKMSLGVYKVTGQAVYVETPNNISYYGTPPYLNRYLATKEVLQQKVDPLINFNEYDNWSSSSNYNHSNQPDGVVDHIIMIWRASTFPFPFGGNQWSGEASLGYGASYTVENETKTIKTGYGLNAGSGVTVLYWGQRSPERNFKVTVHETAHWLLGSGHPYGSGNDGHLVWGMLTGGNEGICANTYERERVAWINPTPITGDILNAPLHDYVEYGTAYKYHPPCGATNEYYYFENHQKINIYDNATSNSNDKGIFVIHQQNIYSNSNNIRIKTSNGQWNWDNPFNTNCWGNNLPAFKPISVNRAGFNNRDMIPKAGGGAEWLFAFINDNNQAVCGDWLHGWGLNNSFNLSYNDVFSPYSNPYTHTWSNSQNNFTMEVFDQNGSILNAKFYITNPLNGKPSKPQDLRVTVYNTGDNAYPKLNWELNLEPDVIASSQAYLIERSLNGGAFTQIATVNGSTSQFIDFGVPWAGGGPNSAAYKIRAKDTQGLTSLYSDIKSIQYGNVWKENLSDNEELITEYKLQQNYPNPFNPVTNILYQLPNSGLVQLKVYDLLGSEVATLVNEIKSEGSYTVSFDASNLPSGVYIYSLRVNDFVQNNKMTLLK